jgi:hypothetical protein
MMGFEPTLFAYAHSASQADSFDHARTTHTMFIFFYQENINLLGNRWNSNPRHPEPQSGALTN